MSGPFRLLLTAVRGSGRWGGLLLVAMVLESAAVVVLPATVGQAVNAALGEAGWRGPVTAVAVLLLLATVAEILRTAAVGRAAARGTRKLRGVVVRNIVECGPRTGRRHRTGDLVSRALQSTGEAATVTQSVVVMVSSVVTSVGGVVALFLIDPVLGTVFLLVAPPVWWLMRWLVRRIGISTEEYQNAFASLSTRFVDAMAGVRTIRASATVDRECERVLAPLGGLRAAGERFWTIQAKAGWQLGLVQPVVQVVVLGTAGVGVVQGRSDPGELLAATGYVVLALGLLRQTAGLARVARAHGSACRIADLVAESPPSHGARRLPDGPGELVLRAVRAELGGRVVLDGIDLLVPGGASVAIVGASGSGKSTLVEIAGGLREPCAGQILLDGVELCELDRDVLRSSFAFAFERPALLGSTIHDAVAYTDLPTDLARVRRGLAAAAANDFVDRLPRGGDTELGKVRLSGGEMQRLGLARAAARPARVLILDDATSSVDTVTEAEITLRLAALSGGMTRLTVARRASTAARADLVLWLSDGRVAAVGPHRDLERHAGYRALFTAEPTTTYRSAKAVAR